MLMNCLSCEKSYELDSDGFICIDCQETHFVDQYGNKWKPKLEIDKYGTRHWYINNKHHREDGPAVEWLNKSKEWYINDKLHREDGPACEYANGNRHWYLNGDRLSEKQWKDKLNK